MLIKRFEAPTLLEAVQRVKEELGPDAVVLSSRRLRREGGLLGLLARPIVEVTAAIDRDVRRDAEAPAPRAAPPAAGLRRTPIDTGERGVEAGGGMPGRLVADVAPPGDARRVGPDPSWRELRISKALVDPLEAEIRALRRAVDALSQPSPEHGELMRELREVRRLAAELGRREAKTRGAPKGLELLTRLRDAGLSERHAASLAASAAERVPGPVRGKSASAPSGAAAASEGALAEVLAERLDDRLLPPRDDAAPTVEIVVGSAGVGKTTSLAKLAAREAGAPRPPLLVTTDTVRFGAAEELRGLAGQLDLPVEIASSAGELERVLRRARGRRSWVDTSGHLRADPAALGELVRARDALGDRARVHLVVSATTKDADLRAELDRYRPLRPDALVVTRVDQSRSLGNVASLLLDGDGPQLTWMGTGPGVPADLWLPGPQELAERILGAVS